MSVQKLVVPDIESPDDLLDLFCTVQDYVAIDCTCDERFYFPSLICAINAVPRILHDTDTSILSIYKRTYNDLYFPHVRYLDYLYTYIIRDGSTYIVSTEEIGLDMLRGA